MRRMSVVVVAALAGACTATVDKQSVRATQTAPESTQVEVVRIPYDPSLPYYVVTVEPFGFAAGGAEGGSAPPIPGRRYGWGPFGWGLLPEGPQARPYNPPPQGAPPGMGAAIAAQLVTALSNVGNVRIIDYDYYIQHRGNPASLVKRSEHEVAGAIAGNTPAATTGAAVAIANPTLENTKARRTGSVAMDLKIVNPGNGRLIGAVVANGSFTNESAASGFSLFGIGKASNAFAASALGQANRAAMNSATTQIFERLRGVR